jgi:predicted HicB family RNase H-like nuclease
MSNKDLKYYLDLQYNIILENIEDEGQSSYIAYTNELGKYACYGQGESYIEAMQNFLKEKNDFIEFLFKTGETIPEPKKEENERFSGFFNVRTSPIIHANLVTQAKELGISLNLYLNQILAGATEKKLSDNLILDKIGELCGKIDAHHYDLTRQLRYQHDTITSYYKGLAEYSIQYLEVA